MKVRLSAFPATLTTRMCRRVYGEVCFESLRAPGAGGTQAENKPTHLTGDRKLASDPYNRRPRSLAAADHQAPDQS